MKRKLILIISMLLFLAPSSVYAQPKLDEGDLSSFFVTIVSYVFPVAALVAVIMIVYGGYMWILSGGDPGKLKQAQGTLTWGIIGLIFIGILGGLIAMLLDYFQIG